MSETPQTDDNIRYYLAPGMREEHAAVLADFARKLERERNGFEELADMLERYALLLASELSDVLPYATSHGWVSRRYIEGCLLRDKIAALKKELL